MADWLMKNWDHHEQDRFIIPGPAVGSIIVDRYGSQFPDDASVTIVRSQGERQIVRFGAVADLMLKDGDELVLPGVPMACGPLMYVIDRLLGPRGCPWDKQQTSDSLIRYLLDESYETLEALVADDSDAFTEELGDVLLQVVFQGALVAGSSFQDIALKEAQKLVRRHPHVFSEESWGSAEEVGRQWDNLKATEPPHHKSATWVYPALVAAKRLTKQGFFPQSPVYQEILALLEVYFSKGEGKIEEILADAAWAVAAGGRIHHQDAEWALWKKVAEMAVENGVTS